MSDDERCDAISAYDEQGRRLLVPRRQWAEEVLPDSLADAWNQPERLRAHVLVALDDGFADVVLAAARRLSAIDPCRERGAAALALVQLDNGQVEAARDTLRNCLEAFE
jgi:hypothetical protein